MRVAQIWMALAFVYVAWGSSFLAIRYGVASVSPWAFAAVRFALVAPAMFGLARLLGQSPPKTVRDWFVILGTGFLMLIVASGSMVWAQQWVPSGEAALIMSASALFTAWFGAIGAGGNPVSRRTGSALIAGCAGVALIVGLGRQHGTAPSSAYAATVLAALAWSGGSMLLRRYPVRCGATMTIAIQSTLAALGFGLYARFIDPAPSTWMPSSLVALSYLVVFGSILGYGAYYWMVPRVQPALLGTISFVNPAFALLLGHFLGAERLLPLQYGGALLVLAAVTFVALELLATRAHGSAGSQSERSEWDALPVNDSSNAGTGLRARSHQHTESHPGPGAIE